MSPDPSMDDRTVFHRTLNLPAVPSRALKILTVLMPSQCLSTV
ncbi:MAG: hypothetical protein ACK5QS_07570 [Pseudanabaenaceae cyanobacterium]